MNPDGLIVAIDVCCNSKWTFLLSTVFVCCYHTATLYILLLFILHCSLIYRRSFDKSNRAKHGLDGATASLRPRVYSTDCSPKNHSIYGFPNLCSALDRIYRRSVNRPRADADPYPGDNANLDQDRNARSTLLCDWIGVIT